MSNKVIRQQVLLIVFCLVSFLFFPRLNAQMKIGENPAKISRSSILELESQSQGLLLPRLSDTIKINALLPPDGTLIYYTPPTGLSGLYIRRNHRWEILENQKGGIVVSDLILNKDSLLTLVYNDGSLQVSNIKFPQFIGAKGEKGDKGDVGMPGINGTGIKEVYMNGDSTLSFSFTNGTIFQTPLRVVGRDGSKGEKGENGRGILSARLDTDSTIAIQYTDGSTFKSPERVIGRDGIGIQWKGTAIVPPASPGLNWAYYDSVQHKSFIYDGTSWKLLAQDPLSGTLFHGNRPVTAPVFNGMNPGTNDIGKWLEALFYPTQNPTADLQIRYNGIVSSSLMLEQMSSGSSITAELMWTAGRLDATEEITSVITNNISQTYMQPQKGGSVTGILPVSMPRNITQSFQHQVRTSDNKTAVSSVNVQFLWKRYYGFINGASDGIPLLPSNNQILELQQSFATGRSVQDQFVTPTAPQRLVIAYPLSWDDDNTRIIIGGLDQTGAFDKQVISFTNASGGNTDYVIYTMKNNTSGQIRFTIQ